MSYGTAGHRRRTTLSISSSSPVETSDPIKQLDHVVDILNKVNRMLPLTTLGRAELIAIGGLLTQISGALLTVTDLLLAPAQHYDRPRPGQPGANATPARRSQGATRSLRECRDAYFTARTAARAFHADLKRGAWTRRHHGNGSHDERTGDESEPR